MQKNKKLNRLLSLLVALTMVAGTVPVTALAQELGESTGTESVSTNDAAETETSTGDNEESTELVEESFTAFTAIRAVRGQ